MGYVRASSNTRVTTLIHADARMLSYGHTRTHKRTRKRTHHRTRSHTRTYKRPYTHVHTTCATTCGTERKRICTHMRADTNNDVLSSTHKLPLSTSKHPLFVVGGTRQSPSQPPGRLRCTARDSFVTTKVECPFEGGVTKAAHAATSDHDALLFHLDKRWGPLSCHTLSPPRLSRK